MLALLLVWLAAAPARPFADERLLLDRRLETLRRILPDGPQAAADVAHVLELGRGAGLSQVQAMARAPADAGDAGFVAVELQGLGLYSEIDRFFRQVALSYRLIDVDSLTLQATPEETVRLMALLRLPYRPAAAPLAVLPDGVRERLRGVPRPSADAYLRDEALALAKAETIVRLRRNRRNPRLFLSELAAVVRDRPVTLSHASLGDEFLVRGLTLGEGPARALETRFEDGYFRIASFLMMRDAACRRFEVRGTSPVVGLAAELPLPTEDPFRQDAEPCRVDRDAGSASVVRGPGGRNAGRGPLTLKLRDVDVADAFHALHVVTGADFVLDGDVTGRVSTELIGVTLEEAFAALARGGFEVTPRGRVWRVARGRLAQATPEPVGEGGAAAARFRLKRASVRELLAVMSEADASLAVLGPEGYLGRISVWADDVPLAVLRAVVLDAAGLVERLEDGRRVLQRASGATDEPVVAVADPLPERRLVLGTGDLALLELELSGLASYGSGWVAFAYTPSGTLQPLRAGETLADGTVRDVYSTDALVETDAGPLRLRLEPLPR